ncbi:hypothetical protein DPEC_G00102840 [Dallia pectoralis]|uniref:Uncharacterized protein n=1 Tax=Dallia pectoralis TaxID=75939 RepID=A0ACC2GWV5_DALPE|nr:hypothetical protein DPEC_G00102840 [Dallia pectoralis]
MDAYALTEDEPCSSCLLNLTWEDSYEQDPLVRRMEDGLFHGDSSPPETSGLVSLGRPTDGHLNDSCSTSEIRTTCPSRAGDCRWNEDGNRVI